MCGKSIFYKKWSSMQQRFDVAGDYEKASNWGINDEMTPGSTCLIIPQHGRHSRHAVPWTWGIVPKWDRNKLLYNSRAETVTEKSMFKHLTETGRCIIPMNHFYEGGKAFELKSGELMGIAGIYNETGFSVITIDANQLISRYHHRMPAILPSKEAENIWLSDTHTFRSDELLVTLPSDRLQLRAA